LEVPRRRVASPLDPMAPGCLELDASTFPVSVPLLEEISQGIRH